MKNCDFQRVGSALQEFLGKKAGAPFYLLKAMTDCTALKPAFCKIAVLLSFGYKTDERCVGELSF